MRLTEIHNAQDAYAAAIIGASSLLLLAVGAIANYYLTLWKARRMMKKAQAFQEQRNAPQPCAKCIRLSKLCMTCSMKRDRMRKRNKAILRGLNRMKRVNR